jgi:cytochrome b561
VCVCVYVCVCVCVCVVVVVGIVRLLMCALTSRSFSLQELSEVEQQLEASSDAFFRKHKLTVNCQLSTVSQAKSLP